MSLQALTYLFVGISFAVYIGIAIWSRAQSTNDFYIAGKGVSPIAMGWLQQLTGCQQHLLSLWLV